MARKRTTQTPEKPEKKPSLALPREEVKEKLSARIEKGREIQSMEIGSESDLDNARDLQRKWHDYNSELLARCFDVDSIANAYESVSGYGPLVINASIHQRITGFRDGINSQITELESIVERLELIPEHSSQPQNNPSPSIPNGKSVFIVHGRDEGAKASVARFVEKLGLNAVILHEQPNRGQTIIEKFESSASDVGFAVVLLTPDDIAAQKEDPDSTVFRARQNVILELGYFCGSLGRDRVCVLYKDEVEIPTDYLGVLYTKIDEQGNWQLNLAREMKASGLEIDLNDAM